ncbi:MAG TPA: hypothetical protein VNZ58_01375 [Thermomicrobiales bacterium]|nr:hypothetical protein [Thermomicrobiales bacterium]
MNTQSHHTRTIQRRVIWTLVVVFAIILAVGTPLVVNDDLRYDLAMRFELIPGKHAEHLADADDDAILVVLPIHGKTTSGNDRIFYRAQFIGRPDADGTKLTDIDSGTTVNIPIADVDFIAADPTGEHVLFRGKRSEPAVMVDTRSLTAESLPPGQQEPDLPGDWETAIWDTGAGLCDRYSPGKKFVVCFQQASAASYFAGDWQIDIQLYGDYNVSEPVFRGKGFLLPMVGFANDDTWIYFQGIDGIWRVEVPHDLQEKAGS